MRFVSSPHLLAIYLDELSVLLGLVRIRRTVGNMVVNHHMLVDDICVFGPSISSLQHLLNLFCLLHC